MNLNVSNYAVLELFGIEIWITETIVNTWIVMALLVILAIVTRFLLSSTKLIPKGFQNGVEIIIETFDNLVTNTGGEKLSFLVPWFFTVFVFIIGCVFISILGFRSPVADFITTFALAIVSFFLMLILGIKSSPKAYFKSLLAPAWPFLPVNIIGELAKPISLSFRLFGNMLSGTIIIIMYNALTPMLASVGIPIVLKLIFDVFFGVLQAYIFVIISLSYINGAISE